MALTICLFHPRCPLGHPLPHRPARLAQLKSATALHRRRLRTLGQRRSQPSASFSPPDPIQKSPDLPARPDALLLRRPGLGAESRSLGAPRPIRRTYQSGRLGLPAPNPRTGQTTQPRCNDSGQRARKGPHSRLTRNGVGIWWFELSIVKHRRDAGRLRAHSAV